MNLPYVLLVGLLAANHATANEATIATNEAKNSTTKAKNSTTYAGDFTHNATDSSIERVDRGCQLIKSSAILERKEPKQEPLLVYSSFLHLKLRDAPNKGGSFGVEFR